LQITVGVRIRIGKVHFVVVVQEGILPCKRIVGLVLESASTVSIFIVVDVLPTSVPTEIFLFRLLLAVNDYFHAHLVKTVLLVLVKDVKLNLVILDGI